MISSASVGVLDKRGNPNKYSGSYKDLTLSINKLLDNIVTPINLTANYLDRISKGDIPEKINENYSGKFAEMKNNINYLGDSLSDLIIIARKRTAELAESTNHKIKIFSDYINKIYIKSPEEKEINQSEILFTLKSAEITTKIVELISFTVEKTGSLIEVLNKYSGVSTLLKEINQKNKKNY